MEEFMRRATEALHPGAHLVETFPILDCLPDFLAKWRRRAKEDFVKFSAKFEEMFLGVKEKFVSLDTARLLTYHILIIWENSWMGWNKILAFVLP
jgi:hypothetical protein